MVSRAVIVCIALWGATTASAEEPGPESITRATDLQRKAFDAVSAGDFETGVKLLDEAYHLVGHPDFLFNIAATYDQWTGHCSDAIAAFGRYFAVCAGKCQTFDLAQQRFPRVKERCTAAIQVMSDPKNADVLVDGSASGRTPVSVPATVGEHTVVVKLPGYIEHQEKVVVAPGEPKTVMAALLPVGSLGRLSIAGMPSGALLRVDGVVVAAEADGTFELRAGPHAIEVVEAGQIIDSRVITVKGGAREELLVKRLTDMATTSAVTAGPVPAPSSTWTTVGWVSLVGAVAAGGAGAYFTYVTTSALDEEKRIRTQPRPGETIADLNAIRDSARMDATFAYVGFGAALALGSLSVVSFLLGSDADEVPSSVELRGSPSSFSFLFKL